MELDRSELNKVLKLKRAFTEKLNSILVWLKLKSQPTSLVIEREEQELNEKPPTTSEFSAIEKFLDNSYGPIRYSKRNRRRTKRRKDYGSSEEDWWD